MKKPLIGVAVALMAATGASAALAAVPGVTSEGTAAPKVKPKEIIYSMGAFFAGTHKVSKRNFGSIHWSKWNNTTAMGSGANWIDDCKPNCAKGTLHSYPLTLKFTQPKVVGGKDVFTRMLVSYTAKLPSHTPKSQTWTLKHSGKAFFWNPPM